MFDAQLHNEDWNPKVYMPRKPCSREYNCGILYNRRYNELDEEKQLVGTAAHIIRQNIHRMLYDSYTYPEPMIITFTTPESL